MNLIVAGAAGTLGHAVVGVFLRDGNLVVTLRRTADGTRHPDAAGAVMPIVADSQGATDAPTPSSRPSPSPQ